MYYRQMVIYICRIQLALSFFKKDNLKNVAQATIRHLFSWIFYKKINLHTLLFAHHELFMFKILVISKVLLKLRFVIYFPRFSIRRAIFLPYGLRSMNLWTFVFVQHSKI